MFCLGNDILSMPQARQLQRAANQRYLDKVFLPHEQRIIRAHPDPELMTHLLWAVKESAYKAWFQKYTTRVINPLKVEIQDIEGTVSEYKGTVQIGFELYDFATGNDEDFITAVAYQNMPGGMSFSSAVFQLETGSSLEQSQELWKHARQWVKQFFTVPASIRKEKTHGVPFLQIHDHTFPVSLSHDHGWGSLVIPVPDHLK